MKYNTYVNGDWNAICDDCGWEYKASELKSRWDGLRVCYRCWEPRHPQDFVRGVADIQAPQWTRSEPSDTYVLVCTTKTSTAGYAISGCAIPNNTANPDVVPPSTFV
jgi:hypothetical protein